MPTDWEKQNIKRATAYQYLHDAEEWQGLWLALKFAGAVLLMVGGFAWAIISLVA